MPEERLTSARCREIATVLRDVATTLGLNLRPASDLAKMIRELTWMGNFPDHAAQPDAVFEVDRRRAMDAFLLVDQAHRIARAWLGAKAVPGVGERARVIRKGLDRNKRQEGPAHDFLFELDIAARLATRGVNVRFEEPDLVLFDSAAGRVGLACKRPLSSGGVPNGLRRATHQIKGSGIPGVVIVGLEAVFHRTADPARPVVVYRGRTRSDLIAEATRQVGELVATERASLDRACGSDGVAGVLLCGVITAWIDEPSAHIFQWVWKPVSRQDTAEAMDDLGRLLFNSDPLD